MPLREIVPILFEHSRSLGRIEQQLDAGETFHRDVRGHMVDIHRKVDGIHQRVATLEAKPAAPPSGLVAVLMDLTKAGKELAKAISSAREWAIGATVVLSSLYAQINPEAVHTWLSKLAHLVSAGAP